MRELEFLGQAALVVHCRPAVRCRTHQAIDDRSKVLRRDRLTTDQCIEMGWRTPSPFTLVQLGPWLWVERRANRKWISKSHRGVEQKPSRLKPP